MRRHLHAYKPISVGPFVTHSGHYGPLDTSFPLEDDYTLLAELERRPHGHRGLAAESWPRKIRGRIPRESDRRYDPAEVDGGGLEGVGRWSCRTSPEAARRHCCPTF